MKRRSIPSLRLHLLTAVAAGLLGLGFSLAPPARAVVLTHPAVTTPAENSGAQWNVGQEAGGAIVTGSLEFDVTGLSQANVLKHQIFAMFDAAQPTAFMNHGYWIHFRKRAELPFDGPGFQFKLQVDCSWDDENVKIDPTGWIPERVYHFTFSWDDNSTRVDVLDTATGRTDSSELPLPSPFKAQDQAIVFGSAGLAASAAFPAEPGARYDNITLQAMTVTTEFDDFDGYPECEFDGGCGCVTEGDPSYAPCSESSSQHPPEPSDTPFTTSISGLRWVWNATTLKYFEWRQNNDNDNPDVEIQAMTPGLPRGQQASFTAVAQNYRTRTDNLYYSWCVKDSLTNKVANYNSVLAGGRLAEASTLEQAEGHGQCCEWITRIPAEDEDRDGMDDNWEREKFIGRAVNGRTYSSIEEVLPGDDPDADGTVMNRFINADEGLPVTVVAGLVDSLGNKYIAGGSDGRLKTVEEYILGTDPLNGDTDGDGYIDEADYLGEGQSVLEFTPEQAVGAGYYEVQVSTVGLSSRKKTYVALATRKVYTSLKEKFEISLSADRDILPVGADDQAKVNLKTNILGSDARSEELYYRWTFQGENVCDASRYPELGKYCDFNQGQITLGGSGPLAFKDLPGMDQVAEGGDYTIGVSVVDSASRQDASAQIRFKKGAALTLTTVCGEATAEDVFVPLGGTRTICLSAYGVSDLDPLRSVFNWSKDDRADQSQSGVGKDQYELKATKLAGESHRVDLNILYGPNLDKELEGSITVPVVGATVLINQPAERMTSSDPDAPGATRLIQVAPGETITLGARAAGFSGGSEYQWSWQDGDTSTDTSSSSPESSFSYAVAADEAVGTTIPVTVTARGTNEGGQIIDAGDTISLLVSESRGSTGAGGGWGRLLAAAAAVISPAYRTSLQIIALLVGVGAILAGGLYFFSRVTAKR